jgi:hypothetical protein
MNVQNTLWGSRRHTIAHDMTITSLPLAQQYTVRSMTDAASESVNAVTLV